MSKEDLADIISSKNEKINDETPPGKIISELPFKEFNVKGEDEQLYNLKIYQGEKSIIFHAKNFEFFVGAGLTPIVGSSDAFGWDFDRYGARLNF